MKLFIIFAILSIFFILVIIIIFKAFYISKLNGKRLNNSIIWSSNVNEYNPSITNNIIAIRICNIIKNNLILSYININA